MEQHRNAFSSGQSLVQMNTVADGLASLSFHQGGGDKREDEEEEEEEEERQWKQKRSRGEEDGISSEYTVLHFT